MDAPDVSPFTQNGHNLVTTSRPAPAEDNRKKSKSIGSRGERDLGGKKGSWLSNKAHTIAGWLKMSEPSADDLNQHRKAALKKVGVSHKDAEAHAKLHAPMGEIPLGTIRPTSGPSPEEAARRKAAERKKHRPRQKHEEGHLERRASRRARTRSTAVGPR